VIVLPKSIQDDPEKIRMAIQHELIHIKRGDYLLQLILSVIESVFWFHPIIRYGSKEIEIYREISCDQEVLNTSGISLKSYATMLLELLPLNRGFGSFSVNMAVQQSTLKKRISTMKNHKLYRNSIKRSILFYLLISIGIITPIACSDMRAPSALDESVLEEMSLTLTNPTFEINGKEVQTHSKSVSINGLDGFMFSVPDYGVFVVSPIQFEGGIQNGEIELNTIDFRVNNMNVTIRSKEVLSDNKIPVFVNHYPNLQSEQFIYGRLVNQILVRDNLASYLIPPSGPIDTKSTNSGNLPMLREIGSDEFVVVEQMPKLIGGMASIQSKIMYPEVAKREGIEGRVVVQFIVTETGEIESPQIVKGIGSGCDEAALEAVMQAKFEPGLQRGEPVRVQYSIPVIFRLDDSDFTGSNNIPTIKQIDHLALGDN
ncbi:MAG: M56 family metallopeptidase, partial [Balneolaceae bacterium]